MQTLVETLNEEETRQFLVNSSIAHVRPEEYTSISSFPVLYAVDDKLRYIWAEKGLQIPSVLRFNKLNEIGMYPSGEDTNNHFDFYNSLIWTSIRGQVDLFLIQSGLGPLRYHSHEYMKDRILTPRNLFHANDAAFPPAKSIQG